MRRSMPTQPPNCADWQRRNGRNRRIDRNAGLSLADRHHRAAHTERLARCRGMERDRDVEQGVTPCPRAWRRGLGSAGGGRRADKLAARVAGLAVVVECAVEAGAAGGARVSRLVVS